jgi:hypothetical protein
MEESIPSEKGLAPMHGTLGQTLMQLRDFFLTRKLAKLPAATFTAHHFIICTRRRQQIYQSKLVVKLSSYVNQFAI